MGITLLDGPMGTALAARGAPTPAPLWSAYALLHDPGQVSAIHAEYAAAGATVHTADTFRTTARAAGEGWADLARRAVALARAAVPEGHRIAGSIAPLEDCYSPWLSPEDPGPEHAALAEVLVKAGCDLLLCETFPHVGEGLIAVERAVATGVEVWASFTAGYRADLLTPEQIADGARRAVERGASAVLVNCVPAAETLRYVERLADLGVPFGAYANAGDPAEGLGWGEGGPDAAARYADLAAGWIAAGATLIGGCCGTDAATIAELSRRFAARS